MHTFVALQLSCTNFIPLIMLSCMGYHIKSLHLFPLSLPAAYHPTPPSYKAHWENTFITASRAMNDYLLDLEYATQSPITTPSSLPPFDSCKIVAYEDCQNTIETFADQVLSNTRDLLKVSCRSER